MMSAMLRLLCLFLAAFGCQCEVLSDLFGSLSKSEYDVHFGSEVISTDLRAQFTPFESAVDTNVYLVRLHETCRKADCHIKLKQLLSEKMGIEKQDYYLVVSPQYAQVTATEKYISELAKKVTITKSLDIYVDRVALDNNVPVVVEYVVMPENTKIHANVKGVLAQDNHRVFLGRNDAAGVDGHLMAQISISIQPKDAAGMREFVSDASAMLKELYYHEHTFFTKHSLSVPDRLLTIDSSGMTEHANNELLIDNIPLYRSQDSVVDTRAFKHLIYYFSSVRTDVLSMERRFPSQPSNRWGKGILQTGDYRNVNAFGNYSGSIYDTETSLSDQLLTGEGEIIGVSDTGLDVNHCYFYDPYYQGSYAFNTLNSNHRKVIYYSTTFGDAIDNYGDSSKYHGTHVAGTVAGLAYNSTNYGDFKKYRGHAYNAKLVFFDLTPDSNPDSITTVSNINNNLFLPMYNQGARIMTNSWGSVDNSYTTPAKKIDTFMYDYPEALILFAAGNNGRDGANSVESPSTNKNGVCVGANFNAHDSLNYNFYPASAPDQYNPDSLAIFSSRGPTSDGRLKPDVTAPGLLATSAQGTDGTSLSCEFSQKQGTSMATPAAAGVAGLIREYFRKGYYPSGHIVANDEFVPSGALLKAMLVHAAQPLTGVADVSDTSYLVSISGINNDAGYGRIQLDQVLNFAESSKNPLSLYVIGSAADDGVVDGTGLYRTFTSNADKPHTFHVYTNAATTYVRVTMTYSDPAGTTGSPLVNDLDLTVTDMSNNAVHYPELHGTGEGSRSNLEVVYITSNVASKHFMINVTLNGLSSGPQPYALVASTNLIHAAPYVSSDPSTGTASDNGTISSYALNFIELFGAVSLVLLGCVYTIKRQNQPTSKVHWVNFKKAVIDQLQHWCCCFMCCCGSSPKQTKKKHAPKKKLTAKDQKKIKAKKELDDDIELQREIDRTLA